MGFDIYMINHTRQQYECLGTAGEGGNFNSDPNDFISMYKDKGWKYGDDVRIGEGDDIGSNYCSVSYADDVVLCECFLCKYSPKKKYWINKTKMEAFQIYNELSKNIEYAEQHDWNIADDDINCLMIKHLQCGEMKYLG